MMTNVGGREMLVNDDGKKGVRGLHWKGKEEGRKGGRLTGRGSK
jgi:hypothetical protein